jgi:hypothetical protein
MGITRVQKNALFEAIIEHGLGPVEFKLSQGSTATKIQHDRTGSFFFISNDGLQFRTDPQVGAASGLSAICSRWQDVMREFTRWVRDVRVESETPDLWEELRRGNEFLSNMAQDDLDNSPFAPAEQAQIATQLKEIKTYIAELRSLSAGQAARLESRFDEAEEASRRLGRKDWILLFGGALFSLVLSAVVPPEVLQHVLTMTEQGLRHLFGGGPPQLPPET